MHHVAAVTQQSSDTDSVAVTVTVRITLLLSRQINVHNMRFGERQLQLQGWSKGKGLGKREDGLKTYLRTSQRRSMIGIGGDNTDNHADAWWEKMYNKIASNVMTADTNNEAADDNLAKDKSDTVKQSSSLGYRPGMTTGAHAAVALAYNNIFVSGGVINNLKDDGDSADDSSSDSDSISNNRHMSGGCRSGLGSQPRCRKGSDDFSGNKWAQTWLQPASYCEKAAAKDRDTLLQACEGRTARRADLQKGKLARLEAADAALGKPTTPFPRRQSPRLLSKRLQDSFLPTLELKSKDKKKPGTKKERKEKKEKKVKKHIKRKE